VNLTHLDLSHNELELLPPSLAALYNLTIFNVSFNRLTEVPEEIFGGGEPVVGEDGQAWVQGMFALKELRMRENKLTNIHK
jgi:Leucine-rich repeat (LRR) protein